MPVLGFIVYKLLGLFGLGAIVYTLILRLRAHQSAAERGTAPQRFRIRSPVGPDFAATHAVGPELAPFARRPSPDGSPKGPMPSSQTIAAMPHAGFWIRMVVLLLDILLIGFVLSLLHPLRHVHLLVLAAYGAAMWRFRGSMLGGIVFDLRVCAWMGAPSIGRQRSCALSDVSCPWP